MQKAIGNHAYAHIGQSYLNVCPCNGKNIFMLEKRQLTKCQRV